MLPIAGVVLAWLHRGDSVAIVSRAVWCHRGNNVGWMEAASAERTAVNSSSSPTCAWHCVVVSELAIFYIIYSGTTRLNE